MSINRTPLPNQVTGLYRQCASCDNDQNLLRCTGCRLILYCSKEHQAAHWTEHIFSCSRIRKHRLALEKAEQALRATPNDGFMHNGDPFVTGVGHFWGLYFTRDYMRARYSLIEDILGVRTLDAVEAALDHFMDMLRLCRGDNMGVRSQVPALFLRLGKDQECYDFVKWWATTGQESDYDWGDTSLPYLDLKNADVFEPVDLFCRAYMDLGHIVSVTLLKIRLLLAMKESLDSIAVLRGSKKLPTELVDRIQDFLLESVFGGTLKDMSSIQFSQLIETLFVQVHKLYKAVEKANKYFWPSLLEPWKHLNTRPEAYSHGSVEEMQLVLQQSIHSWIENPKAIVVIETMEMI